MYSLSVCLADPSEIFNIWANLNMLEESFHWASKVVEAGHIEAQIIIDWFYETGNVVGTDFETSHRLLTLTAEAVNEVTQDLLNVIAKTFARIFIYRNNNKRSLKP